MANATTTRMPQNTLLQDWSTPFGAPPFGEISDDDFREAFEVALAKGRDEIAAIRDNPEPPSFDNVVAALEQASKLLDRTASVFFNLTGSNTNDTLKAIEREMSPVLARFSSDLYLDDALFRRLDEVARTAVGASLSDEQQRVLDRYHRTFRRNGAGLPAETRARLAAISERLAILGTQFSQNVLADEQSFVLHLKEPADLEGLPDILVAAAAEAAASRGLDGHVITLSRSSIEPFLSYSARRDLREKAFRAWVARGENGGPTDNRAIVAETVRLRAEYAAILGYPTYAHFRLDDTMAKTPEAAQNLLRSVWNPARSLAVKERADLQALADLEAPGLRVEPWDWRYYAEKVRRDRFAYDEGAVKPYLTLAGIMAAAFDCAGRLFGLTFEERPEVPVYHPDVRAFEVKDRDGRHLGLFLGDYYARPSKRSGAWMSAFRRQRKLGGDVRPIVVNVMNFAKGQDGATGPGEVPTLLSFDDARTLFHEFGHALHGLLSDVTYPLIAGTSVSRDWVEFPSQLYEHWLEQPEVLARFARHYETGEPMPADLIGKVLASRKFNQGCQTVEYVSSALVDLEFHLLPSADNLDVVGFERASLDHLGMPDGLVMRHRTPHFTHVFAGSGYASAYYSYMWSEVLDADGFAAFEEAGDIFDPTVAGKLHDFVYAAGDRRDPEDAYRAFRGHLPKPEALMRQRGLLDVLPEGEL